MDRPAAHFRSAQHSRHYRAVQYRLAYEERQFTLARDTISAEIRFTETDGYFTLTFSSLQKQVFASFARKLQVLEERAIMPATSAIAIQNNHNKMAFI